MTREVRSPREVGRGYDEGAEGYDERYAQRPSTLRRLAVVEAPLREVARGGRSVLDLGCGNGRVLGDRGKGVVGVDVSRRLLALAARRGLRVVLADAHRMPFASATFDAIVSGGAVFAHLDYAVALHECARVLRPRGLLALTHYAAAPWSVRRALGLRPAPDPRFLRDLDEIRRPARDAGLVLERLHLWRGVPFPPWAIPIPEALSGRLWTHASFVLRCP